MVLPKSVKILTLILLSRREKGKNSRYGNFSPGGRPNSSLYPLPLTPLFINMPWSASIPQLIEVLLSHPVNLSEAALAQVSSGIL